MATPTAMTDHQAIFTPQYVERSGPGSTLDFSAPYRKFVERFIIEQSVKTIVDLGCGDMEVMGNVDLHGVIYVGVDVIEERVERNRRKFPHLAFEHNDLRRAILRCDLVLCKDVIQHWATPEIIEWLGALRTKPFKHALVTNCCYGEVNGDIETGSWRAVDLLAPPFASLHADARAAFCWGNPNKTVVWFRGGDR